MKEKKTPDALLESWAEQGLPVLMFLVNGVKLQGIITSLTPTALVLHRDGHDQVVYKHAISTTSLAQATAQPRVHAA